MSTRPLLPPLLKTEVEACCNPLLGIQNDLDILRWLVWLPLLTRDELARVTMRNESTLWTHLDQLTERGLLDYVVVNETGWPRCHHYHVTDLALYVLAALDPQPISVYKLAISYPVTRADLLERLARLRVHLALSELVTRFIAERPQGYRVSSYQQPYKEVYIDAKGAKHSLIFDAAFLLQTPAGAEHAFCVRVDQPEHMLSQREVKTFVTKLLTLRQARHLSGEVLPHFLLLSSQERFSFWAEQVNKITLPQGISLLDVSKPEIAREHMDLSCSIADIADLSKGAYTRIWTPFHALIEHSGAVQTQVQIGIQSLLDRVAAPRLVERFSQYFSFKEVLLRHDTRPLTKRKNTLTRYVHMALRQEVAPLVSRATPQVGLSEVKDTHKLATQILDTFYDGPEERLFMSTLITLALSDQQKDIMAHLARHPYLERSDLLTLLHHCNERLLTRQITPLINLKLVKVYPWSEALTWRERERYYLHEPALRFLAQRHGLSPAYYLEPSYADKQARKNASPPTSEGKQTKQTLSPLSREVHWVQRGARGLRRSDGSHMKHTSGMYRCVRSILEASYRSHAYQVRYWKSARESQRLYYDPIDGETDKIRPDAELLYTTQASASAQSLLIEYDRDTTTLQQLSNKFTCYLEYQYDTRSTLPTILVITQSEQAREKIWNAIADAKAFDVSIIVVLEEDIIQNGLLPILVQLGT